MLTLDDCEFYHSMTLPGGEVRGHWDLRRHTRDYLGEVSFQGRSVLEIGPASGFLSFTMEAEGANVTCIEPDIERLWDCVPLDGFDVDGWRAQFRWHIQRVRNSFWYSHAQFASSVRVVEAEPYALPASLGTFDIGLLAAVLLHVSAPFQLLEQTARRVRDTIIVTDAHYPELGTEPICRFFPGTGEPQIHTWWQFTPQFFVTALAVLGFPHARVTLHRQWYDHHGYYIPMFTVVARRTA